MKFHTSFERIVGGTTEQQERVSERAEKESSKTGEELFGEYIIEPTVKEKRAIEESVSYANDIALKYGSRRQFNPDRVFVLKQGGVRSSTGGDFAQAVCNSFNQSIAVERHFSDAILSASVVHECLHLNGYHSEQINGDGEGRPYRHGISMRGRSDEGDYFGLANEAIVATLTKDFFEKVISKDEQYREDIERTQKIKEWILSFIEREIPNHEKKESLISMLNDILILNRSNEVYDVLFNSSNHDDYKIGYFFGYYKEDLKSGNILRERADERKKFDSVLEDIVARSDGKVTDKGMLFDQFAKAHFTGNYIPLARIIEDALGKGSFREIAIKLGEMK